MSSARKLRDSDYWLIKQVVDDRREYLQRSNRKPWFKYLDTDACMRFIYSCENAYVVNDAYLVCYEVINPAYAQEHILFVEEVMVLRLVPGSSFDAVTDFFEEVRERVGAVGIFAGTALAKSDRALARLYAKDGYVTGNLLLIKEGPNGHGQ
ncbi:hypothetical protein HOS13_gp30 [Caulobacter phage Lullwater]|uniref:Uncharacterized protein n=1 Tax=Caulobacter phage Lullwater TaxID=2024607 RepID=A0A291LB34_9CAUD|nr:hypothetical protein HOS13_gp30 [Caulobacter phage Lullwater]ATI16337.1 hypothetical protein Lull_030 [Caulobacter phage Lullwater]